MDLAYLYTSFEGRISRKPYWLAALILAAAGVVIIFVAVFTMPALLLGGAGLLFQLVLMIALAYAATALMVKRLHDRNKPGSFVAAVWTPVAIHIAGNMFGLTTEPTQIDGEHVLMPNALGWTVIAIVVGIGIWALFELGLRRGTEGANDFGPDPLQ